MGSPAEVAAHLLQDAELADRFDDLTLACVRETETATRTYPDRIAMRAVHPNVVTA